MFEDSNLRFDTDTALTRARFEHEGARAEVFLQGAHLSRFVTRSGDELLWVSGQSKFEPGQAIRGGVPLIFPWFGPKKDDPNAAAHGFARTMEWQVEDDQQSSIMLALKSNEATLALWPHPFELLYSIALRGEKVRIVLTIQNTGDAAFKFETALHTYLRVSDVRGIWVEGLDGKTYLDKVQNGARLTQQGAIQITGETDRVYLDSSGPILLRDGARAVRISDLGGVKSTVVWNPWIEKARALKDMGDDEWPEFVCIESGVIADDAEVLKAGSSYQMAIEIELLGAKGKNGAGS